MSLYVLDTDTLQLFQDEHPLVISRVQDVAPGDLAISVVTVEEQLSGWYAQLRQAKKTERIIWAYRRLAAAVRFLAQIQIVDSSHFVLLSIGWPQAGSHRSAACLAHTPLQAASVTGWIRGHPG
jgi:tRNA(fMet)-specific endonuclease VapC